MIIGPLLKFHGTRDILIPSPAAPRYPVTVRFLVAITHTFRHIF